MASRPVELLVLKFPGNEFADEIVRALEELTDSNTIRIIDLLFARTDDKGNIKVLELDDLDKDDCEAFDPLVSDIAGVLTKADVQKLTRDLGNNSSAALIVFEDTWAVCFRDVVLNANGDVLFHERIPQVVIEQALRVPERMAALDNFEFARQEDRATAMRRRAVGRRGPGLVSTVAHTAVVAWTMTVVAKGTRDAVRGSQPIARHGAQRQAGTDVKTAQNRNKTEQMQTDPAETAPDRHLANATLAPNVTARIQEFANLRESGVLTDEEFAAAKAKLLGISDL